MSKTNAKMGEFEELLLLAIIRLRDNAYGVTMRQELEERAGRLVSIGALYTTLERLEEKGFISSRQGEKTPERGGRAKRYYKVEAAGLSALNESLEARDRMRLGLDLGRLLNTGRV